MVYIYMRYLTGREQGSDAARLLTQAAKRVVVVWARKQRAKYISIYPTPPCKIRHI
jgi:hypothetical protein